MLGIICLRLKIVKKSILVCFTPISAGLSAIEDRLAGFDLSDPMFGRHKIFAPSSMDEGAWEGCETSILGG
jgi:hypothetical protein